LYFKTKSVVFASKIIADISPDMKPGFIVPAELVSIHLGGNGTAKQTSFEILGITMDGCYQQYYYKKVLHFAKIKNKAANALIIRAFAAKIF